MYRCNAERQTPWIWCSPFMQEVEGLPPTGVIHVYVYPEKCYQSDDLERPGSFFQFSASYLIPAESCLSTSVITIVIVLLQTAMVVSGWSVNITALCQGRIRPPKRLTSIKYTYFRLCCIVQPNHVTKFTCC